MTHAVGLWPTLEALRHRPALVARVVCHPRLAPAERGRLEAACAAAGVPLADDGQLVLRRRRHGAAWVLCELTPVDDRLRPDLDHLVLFRPAQAGNVGSALRAALGFGVRDVALVDARVDPWAPHVLRASQGARFALRVRAWPDLAAYRRDHRSHAMLAFVPPESAGHLRPGAPAAAGAALPLVALRPPSPAAWTFGPEGGGLPVEALAGATRVTIPQDPLLESHNLAVAVGVALYARATAPRDGPPIGSAATPSRPPAPGADRPSNGGRG